MTLFLNFVANGTVNLISNLMTDLDCTTRSHGSGFQDYLYYHLVDNNIVYHRMIFVCKYLWWVSFFFLFFGERIAWSGLCKQSAISCGQMEITAMMTMIKNQ